MHSVSLCIIMIADVGQLRVVRHNAICRSNFYITVYNRILVQLLLLADLLLDRKFLSQLLLGRSFLLLLGSQVVLAVVDGVFAVRHTVGWLVLARCTAIRWLVLARWALRLLATCVLVG